MVIGCGGSGKSTLSRKIHEITGSTLISLDSHYWHPNWVETPPDEWAIKIETLCKQPHWVMDGNYGGTMDYRLRKADTAIFLDFPTWTCLSRVLRRTIRFYGQTRPDMGKDCPERLSFQFLSYVFHYRKTRRAGVLKRLEKVKDSTQIYIFENDHEVNEFLHILRDQYSTR